MTYSPPPKRNEIDQLVAEVYEDNPKLEAALKVDHKIISDIADRLARFGSISDKQIALVFKIQQDMAVRAKESLTSVPVPNVRMAVVGKVLSTKLKWNKYTQSEQLKMLVLVTDEDGGTFRVFGSVPKGILEDTQEYNNELQEEWFNSPKRPHTIERALKETPPVANITGATISFTATLKRSDRDEFFGFFSRPTRAKVIEWT